MLSEVEWEISEELLRLLEVPHKMMVDFQQESVPTISLVAPYVMYLTQSCQDTFRHTIVRKMAAVMERETQVRFSYLDNPLYSLATFLDPNTKQFFVDLPQSHQKIIKTFVLNLFTIPNSATTITTTTSTTTTTTTITTTATATTTTTTTTTTPSTSTTTTPNNRFLDKMLGKNICPVERFDIDAYLCAPVPNFQLWMSSLPKPLQSWYFRICGIPAASCDVERFFSTCGFINSKLRSAMKPENLEQNTILKYNLCLGEAI